jgi:quercetin dioxygenase-like cupin family protein
MQCKVVPPGHGDTLTVVGDVLTFKLTSADTGGRFVLAEGHFAPGGGPPPHLHTREDELFYILDGEVEFFVDDTRVPSRPGMAVWAPRDVVHTFKNVGPRPARSLVVALPCNFENFYRDCGEPFTLGSPLPAPTPQSIEKLLATAPKYGLSIHPEHQFPKTAPPPAQEMSYWVLGELVRFKLVSSDTGGHFCLATITSPPGGGPPPHRHRDCDEIFYIVKGSYAFLLEGQKHTVGPGTTVYVPRGSAHAYKNVGQARGSFVSFHTPGGFENFFLDAGTMCTDPDAPAPSFDVEKVISMIGKNGMELL